jgi:hypothetical protein
MAHVHGGPYVGPNSRAGASPVSVSLFEISIPTYRRSLQNLSSCLEKAEAHAAKTGADLSSYTEARLAPDMHPFTRQVQMASDAAKGGAACGRRAANDARYRNDVSRIEGADR